MPRTRGTAVAVTVKDRIHVLAGVNSAELNAHDVYDPESDAWTQLDDMPDPVSFMGVAAVGDTIYVVGGGAVNLNRFDGLEVNRVFVVAAEPTGSEQEETLPYGWLC